MSLRRDSVASTSVAAYVLGLGPFALERWLLVLVLELPLAALMIEARHALLAVFTLAIPLWFSRLKYRFTVGPDGLAIRWALFEERLGFEAIESVSLTDDPRRFVLGARARVLRIGRRNARPLLLTDGGAALAALGVALTDGDAPPLPTQGPGG